MVRNRRKRYSDLFWELMDGEEAIPSPEETAEIIRALNNPNLPVRESLKYVVKLIRRDMERRNMGLTESDEEREARLKKQREYKREYRLHNSKKSEVSSVSEVSENGQDGQNGQMSCSSKLSEVSENGQDGQNGQRGQDEDASRVRDAHKENPCVAPRDAHEERERDYENNPLGINLTHTPSTPARKAQADEEGKREFEERFWPSYPKHDKKKNALEVYLKARKAKSWPGIDRICEILAARRATDEWTRDNGRFVPLPDKWLKDERWNDELPQTPPADGDDGESRMGLVPMDS